MSQWATLCNGGPSPSYPNTDKRQTRPSLWALNQSSSLITSFCCWHFVLKLNLFGHNLCRDPSFLVHSSLTFIQTIQTGNHLHHQDPEHFIPSKKAPYALCKSIRPCPLTTTPVFGPCPSALSRMSWDMGSHSTDGWESCRTYLFEFGFFQTYNARETQSRNRVCPCYRWVSVRPRTSLQGLVITWLCFVWFLAIFIGMKRYFVRFLTFDSEIVLDSTKERRVPVCPSSRPPLIFHNHSTTINSRSRTPAQCHKRNYRPSPDSISFDVLLLIVCSVLFCTIL